MYKRLIRTIKKLNKIIKKSSNEQKKEFTLLKNEVSEMKTFNHEIFTIQEELIMTMGTIAERRSQETGNHVKRVAEYSTILALKYGLSQKQADELRIASPMHDIGKIAIPDAILKKTNKLTYEEMEIMKTHSQIGYDMLKKSSKSLFRIAAIIAHEHHEKYDGTGYPRSLKGDEIHIYGRITALADVFNALSSKRAYKSAWSNEKVFDMLIKEKGKHFDPDLIDIFFENIDDFIKIKDKLKD